MNKFIKFPHTYHLVNFGTQMMRDDKILPPEDGERFYEDVVIVEEKIDGANIAFSISEDGQLLIQNRGNYISSSSHIQFKPLEGWTKRNSDKLFEILLDRYILFGEWCYATHSIHYTNLPDWFLAFDIFDKRSSKFLSRKKRHEILNGTGIFEVPFIAEKRISKRDLHQFLDRKSEFGSDCLEGIYLRIDDNDTGYNIMRCKVVRGDFAQSIDNHWTRGIVKYNSLKY